MSPSPSSATRRAASRAPASRAGIKDFVASHRARRDRRGPTSSSMSSRRGLPSIRRRSASSSPTSAITGRSAYFGVPELGDDALKAAHCSAWRRCGRIPTRLRSAPSIRWSAAASCWSPASGRRLHRRAGALHALADPQAAAGRSRSTRPRPRSRRRCAARSPTPRSRVEFAYPAGRDHRARRHARPRSTATSAEVGMLPRRWRRRWPDRGADRGRAVLVRGAVLRQPARHAGGLLRARRHPQLPHPRGARRARRVLRRRRRLRRLHGPLLRRRRMRLTVTRQAGRRCISKRDLDWRIGAAALIACRRRPRWRRRSGRAAKAPRRVAEVTLSDADIAA